MTALTVLLSGWGSGACQVHKETSSFVLYVIYIYNVKKRKQRTIFMSVFFFSVSVRGSEVHIVVCALPGMVGIASSLCPSLTAP